MAWFIRAKKGGKEIVFSGECTPEECMTCSAGTTGIPCEKARGEDLKLLGYEILREKKEEGDVSTGKCSNGGAEKAPLLQLSRL